MTISILEVSNRRAELLSARAIKKLKEQRKETRAVMQRFEGASDLSEDEKTTYAHLTLSMVILNALRDQLMKHHYLPRHWDAFTLGSDFDRRLMPLLHKNADGELWVEYFNCERPKEALLLIAGDAAKPIPEEAAMMRRRPPSPGRPARAPRTEPVAQETTSIMDLVRNRMPSMSTPRYTPKRG
jgi:hypothetical protein